MKNHFGSTDDAIATDSRSASFDDVKRDITELKDDTKSYVTDLAEDGAEKLKHGKEAIVEGGKTVIHKGEEAHKAMCDFVTSRPTTAVLMAIGVGAILGRILR